MNSLKNITIKIPEGIRNGEKIRVAGQGKPGINGGKNGDLFIRVKMLPNSIYKLDGSNLIKELKLTPWEAALGTRANIVGIDDESNIYIPEGVQSGEKITIPGKGYKDSKGGRGDLIANIKVMVPKRLTDDEKEIFMKYFLYF